jgi:glycosyltransferase involved in cell wall biosynthesis
VADHIAIQVRELAKRKHRITILTGIENAKKKVLIDNVNILPLIKKWDFRAFFRLRNAINIVNPDIIHIHYQISMYNGKSFITIVPFLIKIFGRKIPTVVTLHDLNPPYLFPKAGMLRKIFVYFLAKYSDAVIVSNALDYRELSEKLTQKNFNRIHLLPIGSNLNIKKIPNTKKTAIGFKNKELILAFFGFVAPDKGIETLLEAFGKLRYKHDNLKLLIIGGMGYSKGNFNVYFKKLGSIISAYSMEHDVIFTGYVDKEKLELYLSIVDICVLPYTEGITTRRTTFFTVMSMGIPTITTCVDEEYLPEGLEDGKNVRLFKPNGVNKLVSILKGLIYSGEEREQIGKAAYTWSLKYSHDRIYSEISNIYNILTTASFYDEGIKKENHL